jgi:hypothetical protein
MCVLHARQGSVLLLHLGTGDVMGLRQLHETIRALSLSPYVSRF